MYTLYLWASSHKKAGLKIFVAVIPKEGLADISSAKPSFSIIMTIELYPVVLAVLVPAKPSFGMTTT